MHTKDDTADQTSYIDHWSIGDRVLAYWIYDCFWYPATVKSIAGTDIVVEFDDGQQEQLPNGYMTAVNIEIGDLVQCRRDRREYYYDAAIIGKSGRSYTVQYVDGHTEQTIINLIRVDQDLPIHWQTRRGFWLLVEKTDNCWWWRIHRGGRYERATTYSQYDGHATHRLAYRLAWGKIPSGFVVRHWCGNAACVNPNHLLSGEHWENMLDEVARRRNDVACGELFSYEDDIDYFIKDFKRRLRMCLPEEKPELANRLKMMQSIKKELKLSEL